MLDESITDLAQRLYATYRQAHPWIRPQWEDLWEEMKEVWYRVAMEARK